MIIQSVSTVYDIVNHCDRVTFYKTVEDPNTRKTIIEVVQYLYDDKANIQPNNVKGTNVDLQA